MNPGQTPLQGLRVLDWTHVLAGPFAAYNLALLGADVVRVERVDGTELIRDKGLDPLLSAAGLGESFVVQGSGKRSLAIDARDARARAALHALIARADVLVENFRPGKLRALGFDPAELVRRHPRLIVCSITGFGQAGASSGRRAYDHVVQAASGLMSANAGADGEPQRVGFPIIDYAVGMQAALAVLAALARRNAQEAAGAAREQGEWLDVSMRDAALTLLAPVYATHAVSGRERPRTRSTAFSGSPLSGTFATSDGHLAIVCNSEVQSVALLRSLARAGAPAGELEAIESGARSGDVDGAQAALARVLAARGAAQWEAWLSEDGVPAARVLSASQAYDHARADAARWPRVELAHADGRAVQVPGPGFGSSLPLAPSPLAAPPVRGEHSRAVLREAGLDDASIDAMIADGVVRQFGAAGARH